MEPNVNEYCLVCKDANVPVMKTGKAEFLCQSCAEAYEHKFVAYKKKDVERKSPESKKSNA